MSVYMKSLSFIAITILSVGIASAQWTRQVLPFPFNESYWLDVYFLPNDSQYGWISGAATNPPNGSADGAVIRTTDGGKTWQGTVLRRSQMLESVHFLNRNVGYASGTGGIFKTTDGGVTWDDVSPVQTDFGWGCHFVNENVGMYLGGGCGNDRQQFYRTSNGGTTWSLFEGARPSTGLTDPLLLEENGLGYASSSGIIWRTLNGGRTWEPWLNTGPRYWQEEITNIGDSFLVPTSGNECSGGGITQGQLRFTTDAGNTWMRFNTGANMFGTFLLSETKGWGCGYDATVLYTSDAGVTWRPYDCGLVPTDDLDDIFFINDDWGWVVGRHIYEFRRVEPLPIKIIANKPMPVCEGDTVILTAEDGFENYKWSNGKYGNEIVVTQGGKYTVDAYQRSNCMEVRATFTINVYPKPKPKVEINGRTILCENDTVYINTGIWSRYKPTWSNGATSDELKIWNEGKFWFFGVDSNGCKFVSDTVYIIKKKPIKPPIELVGRVFFCYGDSSLIRTSEGFARYEWSNGEKSSSIVVKQSGKYFVRAYDSDGCSGVSDSIEIKVLNLNNNLSIELTSGSILKFDSVNSLNVFCRSVNIRNNASYAISAFPYLAHNVSFSIPPTQLPFVLLPGEQRSLSLCFTADTLGFHADTLIIEDTCRPNRLPLQSFVKTLGQKTVQSECEIPLKIELNRAGKGFYISPPYPNPTRDGFSLTVMPVEAESNEEAFMTVYDIYGSPIYNTSISQVQLNNSEKKGDQALAIETKGWARGRYTVILQCSGEYFCFPIYIF